MENIDYWKVLGITILSIVFFWFFSLISEKCFKFEFSVNNVVLTFIGIIATFIVVGNYAQVKDIERKFDDKVSDSKLELSRNFDKELALKEKELEANVLFMFGVSSYKMQWYDAALSSYINALERYVDFDTHQADIIIDVIISHIIDENNIDLNSKYSKKELLENKKCLYHALKNDAIKDKVKNVINFIEGLKENDN